MKIFEIQVNGEKEWVSGSTIFEALKTYCNFTEMSIQDFEDEDDMIEIPKEQWDDYYVIDDDDKSRQSFTEFMKEYSYSIFICTTNT